MEQILIECLLPPKKELGISQEGSSGMNQTDLSWEVDMLSAQMGWNSGVGIVSWAHY